MKIFHFLINHLNLLVMYDILTAFCKAENNKTTQAKSLVPVLNTVFIEAVSVKSNAGR